MSSELENSGIRVAVRDCSVTERRWWRPPYQTAKTVHVHAKHYKHNEDGCTVPDVCGNGSLPLSYSGNVVTRVGIYTHTNQFENCKDKISILFSLTIFYVIRESGRFQSLSFRLIKCVCDLNVNAYTSMLSCHSSRGYNIFVFLSASQDKEPLSKIYS